VRASRLRAETSSNIFYDPDGTPIVDMRPPPTPSTPSEIARLITPEALALYLTDKDLTVLANDVFRKPLDTALAKMVRPPTNRDLGKKLKSSKFISISPEVWQEQLSIFKGLPPEDANAGLLREQSNGVVKPTKVSATHEKFEVKLQDPKHIEAFMRLEDRVPKRGYRSAKLILSPRKEKDGLKGRMVSMVGLLKMKCMVPKGITKKKQMAKLRVQMNIVQMDENADVTFGVTTYPPWVRRPPAARIAGLRASAGADMDGRLRYDALISCLVCLF
jgi:hypothetical protein